VSPDCPTCQRPAAARGVNRAFPFCSERCRLLDLGNWFDGQYRVPGERAGDGAAGPGPEDGDREPHEP
jgi:endogenous inhibitor of DNA gyrase (YacG/DUF329 family)